MSSGVAGHSCATAEGESGEVVDGEENRERSEGDGMRPVDRLGLGHCG